MAENFRHGVPEDLSGWMLKRNRVMPTKKKRFFKLAAQVLSSHVKDVRFLAGGGGKGVRGAVARHCGDSCRRRL